MFFGKIICTIDFFVVILRAECCARVTYAQSDERLTNEWASMSASIIPMKISKLALLVSQRKHIPVSAALSYIYDSPFYGKLYNEAAKWWYLDTESLYKLLELSRVEQSGPIPNNVVVFLTFCVERYAQKHRMTALQAYALFRQYKVDQYLIDGFDMLHTQGEETILHDIDVFITNRKK